ncbi:MAG TPA: NADH:ubiquinone reductase (Na(+)-transporting) subunit A [Verrucomicrobia bacterium]|nr:MAG: hypothetical protein A2X46_07280 [Lentisphaerae bacterium GWF2_57_35]HBA84358.1 NADH:ubiquinone reductase (Na(+)-transporting) subunit A [Verrucomicrobiota bacterium]
MPIQIKRGLDIPLVGKPNSTVEDISPSPICTVYPREFEKMKKRLLVKEGDLVQRGSPLFLDKKNPAFTFCSPVAGTVKHIALGPRRVYERIEIEAVQKDQPLTFPTFSIAQIAALSREEALSLLQKSGLLALIRQRPFSRDANPNAKPKSIFVNAMSTAPFQAEARTVLQGQEAAFQAGLNVLTRLTEGKVHLCAAESDKDSVPALSQAKNVTIHTFQGPHPSGNSSVHIHHIDPIQKGDVVWTIRAVDLVLIGRLLLEGAWPSTRIVALGGPGVKPEARKHYRVRIGTPLSHFLAGKLEDGEQRVIGGDVLSGAALARDSSLRFFDSSMTVIPEDRERQFLGWLAPGWTFYSRSKTFLSAWFRKNRSWTMGTNMHGDPRPMILTGLYDRYLPMNIMVDFLVRAVLAHDVDEAIQLGILETDPEDFALCSYICPSKMDISGIIRQGLEEIEKEGL